MGGRLVQLRVLDRDRGLRGQQRDDLLVVLAEVALAVLLAQVEVAEGDAAQLHRNAQERAHRRVPGRKADRRGMLGQIVQPQHLLIVNQ